MNANKNTFINTNTNKTNDQNDRNDLKMRNKSNVSLLFYTQKTEKLKTN